MTVVKKKKKKKPKNPKQPKATNQKPNKLIFENEGQYFQFFLFIIFSENLTFFVVVKDILFLLYN